MAGRPIPHLLDYNPTETVAYEDHRPCLFLYEVSWWESRHVRFQITSAVSRSFSNLLSRSFAKSSIPAIDLLKATIELYPKDIILAFGTWEGKKSRSQIS